MEHKGLGSLPDLPVNRLYSKAFLGESLRRRKLCRGPLLLAWLILLGAEVLAFLFLQRHQVWGLVALLPLLAWVGLQTLVSLCKRLSPEEIRPSWLSLAMIPLVGLGAMLLPAILETAMGDSARMFPILIVPAFYLAAFVIQFLPAVAAIEGAGFWKDLRQALRISQGNLLELIKAYCLLAVATYTSFLGVALLMGPVFLMGEKWMPLQSILLVQVLAGSLGLLVGLAWTVEVTAWTFAFYHDAYRELRSRSQESEG